MGCPGGHSLSTYAHFSAKKRTSLAVYLSGKTQHNDLFSHYNLFLGKLNEKLTRKARENTERVYPIVLMIHPRSSHNTV